MITQLARLKMRTVTDSGTSIGARRQLFTQVIPPGGVGVELGVYKGTLSQFILSVNRPRRLHLVDPWWEYKPEWHWAVGDSSTARSLAILMLVLRESIESGTVKLHVGGSNQVLEEMPDAYFDWAYVDSTHAYDQTLQELGLLERKVKHAGIIAGDDWHEDDCHPHHGVRKAVQAFMAMRPEYCMVFCQGRQWAITCHP